MKKEEKEKQGKNKDHLVSKMVNYFAEDHGLHTFFVFVIVILILLFAVIVYKYYFG